MSDALQQEIRHLETLEGSERDPRDRVFLPLADAHFRSGEFDAAADMLREGLTRHPDFVAAHVLMGRVLAARGNLDEAEETWAAARRLDPDNAEALLALGRMLVARGEPVGAELILRARALDPTAGGQEPDADLVSIAELAPQVAAAVEHDLAPDADADLSADAEADPYAGVVSIADLAPDGPVTAVPEFEPESALGDDAEPELEPELDSAAGSESDARSEPTRDPPIIEGRVVTRTLAELLASQGQRARAAEMYEELVARTPHDPVLQDRLRELSEAADGSPMVEAETAEAAEVEAFEPEADGSHAGSEDVDDHEVDHRLSRPDPDPDTPTPFAWTGDGHRGEEPFAAADAGASTDDVAQGAPGDASDEDGPEPDASIADYLGGLLSRSPSSPGETSGS